MNRIPIEARFKRLRETKVDPSNIKHAEYYAQGLEVFNEEWFEYGLYFGTKEVGSYNKESVNSGSTLDETGNKVINTAQMIAPYTMIGAEIAVNKGEYYQMMVDHLSNVQVLGNDMRNWINLLRTL